MNREKQTTTLFCLISVAHVSCLVALALVNIMLDEIYIVIPQHSIHMH